VTCFMFEILSLYGSSVFVGVWVNESLVVLR